MIAHMSYVICDRCHGHPAQLGDDADEARGNARAEGYARIDGQDVCRTCRSAES
jgi:hypothetical protein